MATIENAEIFFAKLDPARPMKMFNKPIPAWSVQIRTSDPDQAKEWKKLNVNVKPLKRKQKDEQGNVIEDDFGEAQYEPVLDENGKQYYGCSLNKPSKKRDGTDNRPVAVVGGDLSEVDPTKIGNGSVGNVRVYQYEYSVDGNEGIASMLMAIQVTLLKEFEPKPLEDAFETTAFKVEKVADNQENSMMSSNSIDDDEINF
jgi:hypothetical protein